MRKTEHLKVTKSSTEKPPTPKVDWDKFLDYILTYDPEKHGNNNPLTIQEDVIYGLGISTSNEFSFADGYKKFKTMLIERWSKK
jgi:hypothetical protein